MYLSPQNKCKMYVVLDKRQRLLFENVSRSLFLNKQVCWPF